MSQERVMVPFGTIWTSSGANFGFTFDPLVSQRFCGNLLKEKKKKSVVSSSEPWGFLGEDLGERFWVRVLCEVCVMFHNNLISGFEDFYFVLVFFLNTTSRSGRGSCEEPDMVLLRGQV